MPIVGGASIEDIGDSGVPSGAAAVCSADGTSPDCGASADAGAEGPRPGAAAWGLVRNPELASAMIN